MDGIISYISLFFFVCFTSSFLISKFLADQPRSSHEKGPTAPTPPSLPILGHLHHLKTPLHRSLAALSTRCGPILSLRFGNRPVLLISSPSLVEECFTKNDILLANRPDLLAGKYLGFNYSTILWSPYGPHWRNLRRIAATEILSSHRIQMSSSVLHEEVSALVKDLFRGTDLPLKVDLRSKFSELTLNLMMRMIAEKRYCSERAADLVEARRFCEMVKEAFSLSGASNLLDFLPFLRRLGFGRTERRMIDAVKKRDVLLEDLIDEQRERRRFAGAEEIRENGRTLIDVLLSHREADPEYYTDDVIKGIISGMLVGGTDTTSATLEWAMALLLNHPESLKTAKAEIDARVGKDRLLGPSDIDKLPYLACIINETLRLHPPLPLLVPHAPSEDCTIGGFRVPSGTMLLINAWAIHRDPNLWADPTSFKPERFGDEDGAERKGLIFKFLPFGCGRRSCPGMNMAKKMVALALAALIQCFQWESVREERMDMAEGGGLAVHRAVPLEAVYRPYEDMIPLLSGL